jgi:uncharacterized cupin superfamily protein
MSERPNIYEPSFDGESEARGFANRRARLGRQAGSERLGMSLFELEPGSAAFPLHYHLGNEELLIAIAGRPSLRSAKGERGLEPGEIVALPVGEAGAHQVVNRTGDPVRFAIISEMNAPDIVVRPESNKISAFGRPPGAAGEGFHDAYFRRDAVDLWDGEEPPPPPE